MKKIITIRDIEETAARVWETTVEEMYTPRRFPEIIEPRYVVFHYRYNNMNQSSRYIVQDIPFDRCIVYHAYEKVEAWKFSDKKFRAKHERFINELEG